MMFHFKGIKEKTAYCILILALVTSSLFAWGEQTEVRSGTGLSVSSLVLDGVAENGAASHTVQAARLPVVERFLNGRRFGAESERLLSERKRLGGASFGLAAVLLGVAVAISFWSEFGIFSLPVFGRSWSIVTYIHAKDGKK